MMRQFPIAPILVWCGTVVPALRAQAAEEAAVGRVVEAIASLQAANDIAGLDTLFAPNPWVEIIEGSGVNHGWADYRNNHLKPELAEMQHLRFRFFDTAPQVRGNVAWAPFRYELAADTPSGHVEVEGRGTAILERRGRRWLVVHLHTSGRRKTPGG
ncbi:MAG TPA: nuclear transport factor 2 family protein [Gemmatimonadales bacterium]|nr:nuclear transport factor 2 family protein [Gemmatimonadales bacterium]